MIRNKTAQKFCSHWHGDQWSALYQFASSGEYVIKNHLRYLQEIEQCLHPEFKLYPSELSKKSTGNLIGLKWYFIRKGEKMGIETIYKTHPIYGYEIPFVLSADSGILDEITALRYLI